MNTTKLMVGAARRCISPSQDMLPMMSMVGQYQAVREGEDLHVRAIVIDNGEKKFLFESFEMGGVPMDVQLRETLANRFGFAQDDMMITATHNHSAPGVGRGMPGRPMPENMQRYTELVMTAAEEVVADALANMKPAKYGFGEGKSYININRDELFPDGYWMQGNNWEGCSDKTLAALKFVDNEGNLIAALLNYAMHSTTSFCMEDLDGLVKVTCDIPGIACQFIENLNEGSVVLWQSGAAGNQNPYYVGIKPVYLPNGEMRNRRRNPGTTYEMGEVMGQQHAQDAIKALDGITELKDSMDIKTLTGELQFPTQKFPHDKFNSNYHRLVVDNLLEWAGEITPDQPAPEKVLADMIPCDETAPMKTQLIMLDDIAIYGVGCELYNEIGVLCKEVSPAKHTMITTHIGTPSVGYILDDGSVGHKVFQSFGLVPAGKNNAIVSEGMLEMFKKI